MKNNQKKIIVLSLIIIIIAVIIFVNNKKTSNGSLLKNDNTTKYIAYIKNEKYAIRLDYIEKCLDNSCKDMVVKKYELLNDDTKNMFKNDNLLKNNKIEDVLNEITKKSNINNYEIFSDWNGLSLYLKDYNLNVKNMTKDELMKKIQIEEYNIQIQKEHEKMEEEDRKVQEQQDKLDKETEKQSKEQLEIIIDEPEISN